MINEEKIELTTSDHEKIALYKITSSEIILNKNIFLTHGTFSDRKICLGIARYLAEHGYACWIMEWRNHGKSPSCVNEYNFETIALYDIKSVFKYLFEEQNIKNISCVTHSGGGICLTMFLIKNLQYIPRLKSVTMFSCQSFGAAYSVKSYLRLLLSKYISYTLGYVPGKFIGLGKYNESYFTMKQWFDWNLQKQFTGKNNFNYLERMKILTTPVLSICAKGDTFIAPLNGCSDYLDQFSNQQNTLIACSVQNGFLDNYNHGSVMSSKYSASEIWPTVLHWIEKHHASIHHK